MSQTEGQRRAADAVAAEMAHRGWNPADLKFKTGADYGTINDFLKYERWPRTKTQGAIEKAFGWPPGTIRLISMGEDPPAAGAGSTDDGTAAEVPVGAGVDPEVLAELAELGPEQVQRVRDFMRGIKSGG